MKELIRILEEALKRAKEYDNSLKEQKEIGAPFCPKPKEEAFYISYGGIKVSSYWKDDMTENVSLITSGFVFKTQEQAERKITRVKALLHLERLAEDLNGDWIPEWYSSGQEKWVLKYAQGKVTCEVFCFSNYGMPTFKTRQAAFMAATMLSNAELTAIFNVKEIER